MGCVNAAVASIRCNALVEVLLYLIEGGLRQYFRLHPILAALFADWWKFTRKKNLRLPLTRPILTVMEAVVAEENNNGLLRRTNRTAELCDSIILGVFTSCEFGQSVLPSRSNARAF
jgi:hypothetical protein